VVYEDRNGSVIVGRRARFGILLGVVGLVVFGGGTLLGINLQNSNSSSSSSAPHPATAPGRDSATGGKQVKVQCTSVSGSVSGSLTIGGCDELGATGGSGAFPGRSLGASGLITVTWNGTGTTTFTYSSTTAKRDKCPGGQTETLVRGTVTGNSPLGPGNAGVKGAVHAKLCIDSSSNVHLLPGQAFKL
jgi:hypothetical protein